MIYKTKDPCDVTHAAQEGCCLAVICLTALSVPLSSIVTSNYCIAIIPP